MYFRKEIGCDMLRISAVVALRTARMSARGDIFLQP